MTKEITSVKDWLDVSRSSAEDDRSSAVGELLPRTAFGRRLRASQRVRERLMELLSDPSRGVRHTAMLASRIVQVPEAVTRLIEILEGEPDEVMQCLAAEALGYQKSPAGLTPLLRCAEDRRVPLDVREHCIRALGTLGQPGASAVLLKLSEAKSWKVQWAAAMALWMLEHPNTPVILQELIDDPKMPEGVHKSARWYLSTIVKTGGEQHFTRLVFQKWKLRRRQRSNNPLRTGTLAD